MERNSENTKLEKVLQELITVSKKSEEMIRNGNYGKELSKLINRKKKLAKLQLELIKNLYSSEVPSVNRGIQRLIENTKKFDSEYPIDCRKKNDLKYLFLKPNQVKELDRLHLN